MNFIQISLKKHTLGQPRHLIKSTKDLKKELFRSQIFFKDALNIDRMNGSMGLFNINFYFYSILVVIKCSN